MAYKYRASGAIVLRGEDDDTEVLVIHRPRYDDWSLPKGGVEDGEADPVAAVREVLEETGYQIRLSARLQPTRHTVKERTKVVNWWLGELVADQPAGHDSEADEVTWWPIGRAIAQLSYQSDLSVLTEAVRYRQAQHANRVPLLIIRHGKAMPRRQFKGDDDVQRPLSARGERQAQSLVRLLSAFGVTQLASSSAKRCMDTLAPYAAERGIEIQAIDALTEQAAEEDPRQASKATQAIRDQATATSSPTAICGHRPVLPTMLGALDLQIDHSLETAEAIFVTVERDGDVSQPVAIPPEV